MPNYEITVNVHVPEELAVLVQALRSPTPQVVGAPAAACETQTPARAETPVKPTPPVVADGPVTIDDAKNAVRKWAETNGGPAKAKDALATHFGVKLSEIDESQAEAVYLHFAGAA